MHRFARTQLAFTDILILAVIFFGEATVNAVSAYLSLRAQGLDAPQTIDFSQETNYSGILMELAMLLAAYLYLRWRRFDFRVLNFAVNRTTLPLTLLFIVSAGAVCFGFESAVAYLGGDAPQEDYAQAWQQWGTQWIQYLHQITYAPHTLAMENITESAAVADTPAHRISFSHFLFALLNGFYEELFFLGLIFAVHPRILPAAFAFSLFVRFIFHVYQGIIGALSITTLGIVFYLYRRKISTLVPFMLAHSFFDIYGLNMGYWLHLSGG